MNERKGESKKLRHSGSSAGRTRVAKSGGEDENLDGGGELHESMREPIAHKVIENQRRYSTKGTLITGVNRFSATDKPPG